MSRHDAEVVLLALGAALLFATSNVLQQRSASAAPADRWLRPGLLAHLARQRRWLLGIASDVGGYVCQAAALGVGLLVVVQPILATALLFTLAIDTATSDRSIRRRDWAAAALLAASLGLFLSESSPGSGRARAPFSHWVLPLCCVTVLVVAAIAWARRANGPLRASLLGLAAGTTFGITAGLTKAFVHLLGQGPGAVLSNWEPYALAVFTIGGFLLLQSAFQSGDLIASVPLLEAAEPVVASVLGLALLGERLHARTNFDKAVIAASAATMFLCAVFLARRQAMRGTSTALEREPGICPVTPGEAGRTVRP
ncbi:MAG TPA: DMT family transporter [Acidimicrobiia bacterium]|nr:DMT family transporter [Acidimicrobiia bacterium]